ncbi:hypothetical protein D9Q98_000895 [Chlorella vulgaris]|uniref:Uncharacterized protein n=1 Tax=Chlorella vulgaris TaxID=3077 RepID=A0A9D4U061_CHLVU|nr:hypothetical protein D9Q98_000895 [Chlorella vulgaris]
MMHFQPLRGGLVAATAAFSSAMHGPTPGLMARMVATVEYFDRFNELDASYRSVEARVANTRLALVDLEATMAPLAAAHQQATNAAAAVEDNFRLAQLQALPQVLLHLQGMVPLLQQAMQPVDHLTALSPRHAHRELARKSREEYDKQGGAHPQQLQHKHQRAAASPHLRARRVSPAALRGATTYSETSDDELISDTDEEEENGPLVTAPSAGGDDPLALAQPYPQQITSPFASQAWDASARSFGSQHLQGCTQEQLQAALQVASTAYQCQMPALLQLQQQQVLQPPGSAGMRAWGGGAVELGGASLAALHPSTAMHPQGIPDHLQLPVSEGPWAWHEAGPLGYGGGSGSWGGPGSGIGGDAGGVETAAAPSAGADDAMMAMYQQFGQEGASPSASEGLSICEGMGAEENATSMDLEWGPPVPFRPPGDI